MPKPKVNFRMDIPKAKSLQGWVKPNLMISLSAISTPLAYPSTTNGSNSKNHPPNSNEKKFSGIGSNALISAKNFTPTPPKACLQKLWRKLKGNSTSCDCELQSISIFYLLSAIFYFLFSIFGTGAQGSVRTWVTLATAQTMIASESNPQIKWSRLRELCSAIYRLRRGDFDAARLSLDQQWLEFEKSSTDQQRERFLGLGPTSRYPRKTLPQH